VGLISGNKIIQETDYSTPGGFAFSRTYNSNRVGAQTRWTHNLYRRILRNHLVLPGTATTEQVWLHRGSRISYFVRVGGVLVPRAEQRDKLVETATGYTYTGPDDTVETFGPDGTLFTLTTRDGRGFSLTYFVDTTANTKYANATDVFGRVTRVNFVSASPITAEENYWVSSIVTPIGSTISYEGWPNLARVVSEDGGSRRYFYAPAPGAATQTDPMVLTSAEDEKGWTYAEYTYNTAGQVLTEHHLAAAGVFVNSYAFNPGSSYSDPLGTTRSYSTALSVGASRITGYSLPCTTCGSDHAQATTYDTNGNVASRTDFNGKKVCYAYDLARNLETTRVEGLLGSESCTTALTTLPNRPDVRKTATTWHATYRLPMTITEPAAAAIVGGPSGTKLTEFTYDASGNVLQKDVTAPRNDGSGTTEKRTWKWTYNSLGQVLTATDPTGNQTTTVYYPATDTANPPKWTKGDVQTVTNAAGHVTTFNEYDRNGRLLRMTAPNGLVTTMAYHPRGWLTSRSVNNGTTIETTSYTYDKVGQLTQVTMPDGTSLYYAYDDAHRLVGMSDQVTGTTPETATVTLNPPGGTSYTVTVQSLRVQLANLTGNKIVYTLDNMGNRVREAHYDTSGTLVKRKQRAIDSLNRLKQDIGGTSYASAAPAGAIAVDASVVSPPTNAAVTQYGYDDNGNLKTTTDPLGRVTTNNYDALNRLLSVIDPYNGVSKPTSYTYDKAGNLETVTDPQGLTTSYTYNGHNNLIAQASPDTGTTRFTYNAMGNVVTKFDAEGRCSFTTYDTLHRVTAIRHFASSNASTNTAAGCAAATTATTTVEETVSYAYDGIVIPGQGGVVDLGRLFRISDGGGRIDYRYDMNGRVTSKTQTVNGADNPTQTVTYRYNSAGQLESMVTPSGQTISYGYDNPDEFEAEQPGIPPRSRSPGKLIRIAVNGVEVVKGAVYEPFGPNGGWSWGNHGSPVANSSPLINQHLRVFDLDYRPIAISSDPEGYNRNISWDRANRITDITVPGTTSGTPSITLPGLANAMSVNQRYQYDALDRLTQFNAGYPGASTLATGQGLLPDEAFTYDAIGNRLTRTSTPPGSSASTATYAYPNLASTVGTKRHILNTISGAQVNAYTYDLTGNTRTESAALGTAINPTSGTALSHTFDAKNRLKQVQIGATATDTVTYKLNGLGQRYQKTGAGQFLYSTSTTVNATTGLSPQAQSLAWNTRYVYDEQGRLLGEYSPEGKLIAETIWFDDLPVATIRPLGSSNQLPVGIVGAGKGTANNVGNNTSTNPVNVELYYLHPDHLGTPRVATRSAAVNGATSGPNAINKAVWRWDSDPFGTSLGNSTPNENPQNVTGTASQITAASFRVNNRFPGQLADAESGKYYNYFRDYDPSIGRYTRSDPLGLLGGMNLWLYGNASPIKFTDPFGLEAKEKPPLCRDGDCPVPYEPSDDGPKPGGADPPTRAKDKGYERWIEKCAEKQCDVEGWGKFRKWCCEKITISACKRVGANFNCCDCVKHACISDKRSQGLEEAVAYAYCQSQLLLCMGRMK
jgi:RHS repeat-associated protein